MITPTVGRVVWFHAGAHETTLISDQPLAAIVTYVHADDLINLVVFGKEGDCHKRASVKLLQDDEDVPARGHYAEWMPFQKGQAKRYEAESEPVDPPIDTKSPTYSITPVAPSAGLAGPDASPTSVQASEDPYASSVA